jgi:chromosomal replication initiation ATPase DnaA
MDGLGHAIWAARAEKKFRPQTIVDKSELENALRLIAELRNKNRELLTSNNELSESTTALNIELSTYRNWDEVKTQYLPLHEITAIVCRYFKVTKTDLASNFRHKKIITPRHIAFYLCHKHTIKSYPEIARSFGGRDHTSIMYGASKIEMLRATDAEIAKTVESLELLMAARLLEMQEATNIPTFPVHGALAVSPAAGALSST